jgi:hypothetical protein
MCTDIIFTIYNIALNKIEPIVDLLSREINALSIDVGKRKGNERIDVMNRIFTAKYEALEAAEEVENKLEFLATLNDFTNKSIVSLNEVPFKVKFLTRRL